MMNFANFCAVGAVHIAIVFYTSTNPRLGRQHAGYDVRSLNADPASNETTMSKPGIYVLYFVIVVGLYGL